MNSGSSGTSPTLFSIFSFSRKMTGSSERIALLSSPLASAGVEGRITVSPGMCAYQASSRCEWVAARLPAEGAAPNGNLPSNKYRGPVPGSTW